jgi:hypothetical protein
MNGFLQISRVFTQTFRLIPLKLEVVKIILKFIRIFFYLKIKKNIKNYEKYIKMYKYILKKFFSINEFLLKK